MLAGHFCEGRNQELGTEMRLAPDFSGIAKFARR
jgi:hypothetical protein